MVLEKLRVRPRASTPTRMRRTDRRIHQTDSSMRWMVGSSPAMTTRRRFANDLMGRATAPQSRPSALRLPHRLVDMHGHLQALAGPTVAGAAHRGGPQIVEADRDPDVGIGGADAVGRIERDPAELGHERFRPGVAGILLRHA